MGSRINQEASRKSLQTHQTRQGKFAKGSNSAANTSAYRNNPIYNRGMQDRRSYDNYYGGRDRFYGGMGWSPMPWAFGSYASFGMWDAMMWWFILDRMHTPHYSAMAYHHGNDPGYKEWRSEAERLGNDNAELKGKLSELDREVAKLNGTARNASYLPPGMDPSIALAAEAVASAEPSRPQLVIGTGIENGNYHRFGKMLQAQLPDFDVVLEPSNGSEDNLNNLIGNRVDAVLVQSDLLNAYLKKNPSAQEDLVGLQSTLYTEYVQLLVNKDSGISAISDLDPGRHIVYVGPRGSGTHNAWEGFSIQKPEYGQFNVRHASYDEAIRQAASNPNAVMLFVGGLNSELVKNANTQYGDKISLVAVDESSFSKAEDQFGNPIYESAIIPNETYPNLQEGWLLGFLDSSVATLSVEAVLLLSKNWVDTYGSQPMTVFEDALWKSIDGIKPIVGEK